MDDPYTGYLNVARNLANEAKQRRGQDPNQHGDNQVVTSAEQMLAVCKDCGEPAATGYRSTCCEAFYCTDCVNRYLAKGFYGWLFVIDSALAIRCAWCKKPMDRTDPRLANVPARALPVGPGGLIQSDELAWNLALQHNCGSLFSVQDWTGCDVLAGGCHQCSAPLSLIENGSHSTFQMQEIWDKGLLLLHADGTAESFAALRQRFPGAWATLRLSALVTAVAAGTTVDLSAWPGGARALLLCKSTEIQKLLS